MEAACSYEKRVPPLQIRISKGELQRKQEISKADTVAAPTYIIYLLALYTHVIVTCRNTVGKSLQWSAVFISFLVP
jgi:hypothetical protein